MVHSPAFLSAFTLLLVRKTTDGTYESTRLFDDTPRGTVSYQSR